MVVESFSDNVFLVLQKKKKKKKKYSRIIYVFTYSGCRNYLKFIF